jgi:hypothetical protein
MLAARRAGHAVFDAIVLDDLVNRYRALTTAGLAANLYRRTATAKDARPPRQPVPQLRGHDPAVRDPPLTWTSFQ